MITGSGIDVEAGLPFFRGEKGYYENREAAYLASVDALNSKSVRLWEIMTKVNRARQSLLNV